ncbi:ribosome-associated protein [Klebsiella pneumoniae]|uniref:Ribosome-associated protein n=1 Tax=Klebsiella pneumoniae TaxID=573 RepID=A0A378F8Y5_KLEPN|nr:ribosome-associated protein [Klebsiella pneumoniae]
MATFSLGKHPHVELCDLLKLEGWSESGAQAKNRHRRRAGKSRRRGGNPQTLQNRRWSDGEL